MRTDLPGNPNRPSRAPRAYFPCKIALYLGRAPFWAPRGARRDPVVHSRLISGRLHTASYPVVYRSGILGRTVLAPPGWPRALDARSAPAGSGPRYRGAVPADPDVLWC